MVAYIKTMTQEVTKSDPGLKVLEEAMFPIQRMTINSSTPLADLCKAFVMTLVTAIKFRFW